MQLKALRELQALKKLPVMMVTQTMYNKVQQWVTCQTVLVQKQGV